MSLFALSPEAAPVASMFARSIAAPGASSSKAVRPTAARFLATAYRSSYARVSETDAEKPSVERRDVAGPTSEGALTAEHVKGPAIMYAMLLVLAATMFGLDYVGRGKTATLLTVFRLQDVAYTRHTWSGLIAMYCVAMGISAGMLAVCLALLWAMIRLPSGSAFRLFRASHFGMLNVVCTIAVDMVLAYMSATICGMDEMYQVTGLLALTAVANLFMRLSHTTDWPTLTVALVCRLGGVLVPSLNISLTDMVIDNRSKTAFVIYAVMVLIMDLANVLSRIARPLVRETSPKDNTARRLLRTIVTAFSSGTYPRVSPPDNEDDVVAAKQVAMASFAMAIFHAIGLVTACCLVFLDVVDGYARVDFNVKNMFVWSRGWPYLRWFVPIMWGAPVLLYTIQGLFGGLKRRWAINAFDTLSMPGTSVAIAIQDFCIVTLLGPIFMVTEWQELALVGLVSALSIVTILNVASLNWIYHAVGALGPLMPFLFVVTRIGKINYNHTDTGLVAFVFSLFALRSLFVFGRTKVFGFEGTGVQCTDTLICFIGDKKGFWAWSTLVVPGLNALIAISVTAIVFTSPYYYADRAAVPVASFIRLEFY